MGKVRKAPQVADTVVACLYLAVKMQPQASIPFHAFRPMASPHILAPQVADIVVACLYLAIKMQPWAAIIVFITVASYVPLTVRGPWKAASSRIRVDVHGSGWIYTGLDGSRWICVAAYVPLTVRQPDPGGST